MKLNRKLIPTSQIPKQFIIPEINSFDLENGLSVHYSRKTRLPIIKVSLLIPAGSRHDGYGNEGLSYLTSLLIDEGAGNYNALQLAEEIDKLGSSIDVSASVDHIFLTLTSLTENFKRTLELFTLILNAPQFGKESFNREKKKHSTKILQSFDNPSYIAANAFQRTIFHGSPYDKPILGYESSVDNLTLQHVKDFYNRFFLSTDLRLIVVGDVEINNLVTLLEDFFSNTNLKVDNSLYDMRIKKSYSSLYFIHKDDATQSEIVAGHLCKNRNATDHLAAKVANSILGGQFSSRINLNLREDKGYTYGAHSGISYNKYAGYFNISTSVQSEFTIQSIQEIQKEVDGIRTQISDEEIAFAKSSLVKQFPSMFETYSQIVDRITTKVTFDLDDVYEHYIQNLWDLTKDEILNAANEYFKPDELSFFVVGNRDMIYKDFDKIIDLELIELDKLGNPIT